MHKRYEQCSPRLIVAVLIASLAGCVPSDPPVITGKKVAAPNFVPLGGPFTSSVQVTIVCDTAGATIHYTTDGSTPSSTAGVVYQGPFELTDTATVRAIASAQGKDPSDVVAATFTKSAGPAVNDASATGTLSVGQSGAISVSCKVTAGDVSVTQVTADLSALGGSASQLLTASGDTWSWSGTVTPSVAGTATVTFTATDANGVTGTGSAQITVSAPANSPPSLSDLSVQADLTEGTAGSITVSCRAADADGTIASVVADLSQVGGASSQTLALSHGVWSWSGMVTPSGGGSRTITFKATDDKQATTPAATTITVAGIGNNQVPTVSGATASGTLAATKASAITVSCTAADADGTVSKVTVDLTALNGPNAQALTASGNQWSWTGSVTPASAGDKTIIFTATDDGNATGTASATITVAAAPVTSPTISGATATGHLIQGQSGGVIVQCTATETGGTIQSVKADLSAIGGSATQALAGSGSTWTWTGNVTPGSSGTKTITFTATDAGSKTATTTATISVAAQPPPIPTSLTGTWGTTLTYSATTTFGSPLPTDTSDQPCSVTFSSTFQPSTLPVCTGDSSKSIVLLSMSNLVNVGDQATANLQVNGAGRTYALSAQVTAVTHSASAYSISMTMTINDGSGPSTGPYTWSAALGSDGHVAVSGTAHYVYPSPIGNIITDVQSSGTLTKQ